MTDPRKSSAYVLARKRWMPTSGDVCCLCGEWVDKTLSGNHPWGPTVEHTVGVTDRPDLALDTSLWLLAHRTCNVVKGASLGGQRVHGKGRDAYEPSREW